MIKLGMKTPIRWHNKLDSSKAGKFAGVDSSKLVDGREHQGEFVSVDGKQKQSIVYHSTHNDESVEAILEVGEINEFYERLNSLQILINEALRDQSCTYGKISGVELGIIRPVAAKSYNQFQPEFGVRAFRLYQEGISSVYNIDDYNIQDIINEIKKLSNEILVQLKEKFDTGNF